MYIILFSKNKYLGKAEKVLILRHEILFLFISDTWNVSYLNIHIFVNMYNT